MNVFVAESWEPGQEIYGCWIRSIEACNNSMKSREVWAVLYFNLSQGWGARHPIVHGVSQQHVVWIPGEAGRSSLCKQSAQRETHPSLLL